MSWALPASATVRTERHFGDRLVRCFADRPASVWEAFARACAARPDAEALVCGKERLTYGRLAERSVRVAAGLAARGIKSHDRVGVMLGNRVEFASALLGILHLGAIAVPINTRLQRPEIAYILAQCGARLLVHESSLAPRVPPRSEVPTVEHILDERQVEGDGEAPAVPPIDEEDTAIILYTSGTTGRPKGAMLTHFNIVHSLLHYQYCFALDAGERAVLAVPASHVTGAVAILLTIWNAHGCAVVMPEFKARGFLELAERERITYTILVPAMYNLCLLQPDFDRFDLSSWRVGGYGGAPMPEATIATLQRKLPQLGLHNAYGSTETTSPSTLMPAGRTTEHPDSVGWTVPCGEIIVVGTDEKEVAPGETGELWIRGPMVVPGYWDNPEATRQSFTDGYWRSGDLGSIDADGFVRVFDRLKDMINRAGYKVYSVEVENVLSHHPAVLESAVVAKPCPVLGERVHAFVTLKQPASADDLKRYCAERLADYKVPETFTLLDRPLPRNANGKLLKRELRDAVADA
ncbi:MAG TPA: class I adenylate-forming enzyme family protein [Burkholderiales bacterium]|nr:class I adenylate-forming enzyme family protein [Burkholderiales bacterium]